MRQGLFSRAVRRSSWHGAPGREHPSPSHLPLCLARSFILRVGPVGAQLFGCHTIRCLPLVDPCETKFSQLQNPPCDSGRFSISHRNFKCIYSCFCEFCCLIGGICCIKVCRNSASFQRHSCRRITILCLLHLLRAHEAVVLLAAASAAQQNPERKLALTRHTAVLGVRQLSNP